MAINAREQLWSRLHFLTRLLGLIGLGTVLFLVVAWRLRSYEQVRDLLLSGQPTVLYSALGLLGIALLVELLALLSLAAGRRNILGLVAMMQVVLALALVIGVNVYSFQHPQRWDLTRTGAFTLPEDVRQQLATLRPDPANRTRVIVYQVHKAFAGADKPDLYDTAAERKIVEKVQDLVELLREFGSSLQVELLDVQEKGYQDKLDRLTAGNDRLREAINAAPENSIFLVGANRVQQMSFNEFYLLDRFASQEGRGNLVLLGQGPDGRGTHPFVRRILNLEQRRPRVGVLIIHELLATDSTDPQFSLAGLRKALTLNGFDVQDIMLKKGWERGARLEAAADSLEESKLDRVEAEIDSLREDLRDLEAERKTLQAVLDDLRIQPGEDTQAKLKQLTAKYGRLFVGGRVTEAGRLLLQESARRDLNNVTDELANARKELQAKEAERASYDLDRVAESRRLSDIQAKLSFALADCDLVIIPRLTRQSSTGQLIIPRLYRFSDEQLAALREFVQAGKPLLVCSGPINEPAGLRLPPELGPPGPDGLERLLTEAGFRLGKHTVLFNSDSRAFAERRQELFRQSSPVEVPALDFETVVPPLLPRPGEPPGPEHPLRRALRVLNRSVGEAATLRFRFPRPVTWTGPANKGGSFLVTAPGWNEERPFPSADWRPRYTPPKPDDPDTGTPDARRRGAFSVAAAGESTLAGGKAARLAVIGQGEVFHGSQLEPARERLLLVTTNWLLGRDDYLPTEEHPWSYPRLNLTPEQPAHEWWLWGSRLGLPALFAFLGAVVLLFRRLR